MLPKFFSLFFLVLLISCPCALVAGKSKMRLQQAHGVHHQNKLYDVNQTKRRNTKKSRKVKEPSESSQAIEHKAVEK